MWSVSIFGNLHFSRTASVEYQDMEDEKTHDKLITSAAEPQTDWGLKAALRIIWSTLPSPEQVAQDQIQTRLWISLRMETP